MADPAHVDVLGALEVADGDGTRRPVPGRRQRALLSLLVLHRDRPVSAARLVDGLWGDAPPRGAEVTLRSHVSHLRRLLAGSDLGGRLETAPDGYRLVLPAGSADVDRFEHLVGVGQEALGLGDAARAATHLREALGLWRGRPYADLDGVADVEPEVTRLEALRLAALEAGIAAELALGRHGEVVGELEALVAAHPFHERFCAQLMLALYRSGRQADALEVFSRARARLAEELGLDPGPELQGLNRDVLRQDPTLLREPPAPSATRTPVGRGDATPTPHRPRDAVFSALARSPLVGRDAQTARLDAAWQHVVSGGRAMVLVPGPAGIGKTHLVAALADRAADTANVVLVGRCDTSPAPFQPIAAALRGSGDVQRLLEQAAGVVGPAVAALVAEPGPGATTTPTPGADATEEGVATGVVSLLGLLAAEGPVLLVVEDAEKIDPSSAVLLGRVVERLPAGVLVVIAYRDPPGALHPPLTALLGEVAPRESAERVALGPLDEAALADLVRSRMPGAPDADALAARLWEHTGGNPFYAVEVVRSLAATGVGNAAQWPVPAGVRDVLRHRLSGLPGPTRDVLPVAAVLGSEVDVELLAQVARLPEDEVTRALDEGVSAGLLVPSGTSWAGRYAFPQQVVRDALRSDVTGLRLRTVHLHAAEGLRARPRPARGEAAAIAAHLREAGGSADPEETARFALLAAGEAAAVFAWGDALGHAESAVALLAATGPPTAHARAAVTTGMLWLRSGRDHRRGLELLEAALPEYLAAGEDEAAGGVHSRIGGALCLHHSVMDIPRSLEHFDAAERLISSPETAYHLHRGRAQAAMMGLRTHLLEESARRAGQIAESLGRRDLAVVPGWARGWAAADAGHLTQALAHWEDGWRTAHERSDAYLGWSPVNAAAMLLNVHLLDPPAARAWCRRGLAQPRLTSFTQPHDAVVDHLALALAAMGEMDDARRAADRLPEDAGSRRMLLLLDGRWEEAAASWSAAVAADESAGDLHDAAVNLRWLAEAQLALGDVDATVASLGRALTLGREGPQVPTELAAGARLAQLVADDRPEDAVALLARCDEIVSVGEHWRGVVAEVQLARAAVAAARGDAEASDTASGKAVAVLETHRLGWRRAGALTQWARHSDRRGAHRDADERWRQAREAYARLGAPGRWLDGVGR